MKFSDLLATPEGPAKPSEKILNSLSLYGLVPYKTRSKNESIALLVVMIITGAILLIIIVYYFLNPRQIIGSQLVYTSDHQPFEIPSPNVSPLYVKPITILFASGVVFSFCLCSLSQRYVERYAPRTVKVLVLAFSALLLAMGVYEIFFNFSLWSALMASNPSVPPDLLYNDYPVHTVMINLAFATKLSVLWVVVAFFVLMTFRASLSDEPT